MYQHQNLIMKLKNNIKFHKSLLMCVLASSVLFLTACGQNYSNGSRVGVVNKLSHKGLVFKSWEGEMNLGGFRNKTDDNGNTSVVANTFAFNVQDEEVVKRINESMRKGERVELVYQQWFINPFTQDSDYTITEVKTAQ